MFKNPFSFKGRIRRTEFWLTVMIYWVLVFVLAYVIDNSVSEETSLVGVLLLVALIWFVFAQSTKRCHDLGRNGLWMFMPFYFIRMLFIEGGVRSNKYGANPKGTNDPRLRNSYPITI
ncbi:MAG TPA: DUF805 domain-containing protein [Pedobacter sp.]|uniref:DUF805 domain-containing protein n=1 Tax=Pedobacter sp. TaxID=1411316 RepID=UPI002C962A53|nr:DUF805 domain-containing protein [Pedobacter sp.]HMI03698.1 DUF805 domain-containing protein [Pedobacter sp.]